MVRIPRKQNLCTYATIGGVLYLKCFVVVAQGKCAEAEPLFKRSLAITEKVYGRDHSEVTTILDNLGGLLKTLVRCSIFTVARGLCFFSLVPKVE